MLFEWASWISCASPKGGVHDEDIGGLSATWRSSCGCPQASYIEVPQAWPCPSSSTLPSADEEMLTIWLSFTILERNTSTESSMGMGPGPSQSVDKTESSLNPVTPDMSHRDDLSTEVSPSIEDGGTEDSSRVSWVSSGDPAALGGDPWTHSVNSFSRFSTTALEYGFPSGPRMHLDECI